MLLLGAGNRSSAAATNNAVTFDGSTTYTNSVALTGLSNSKVGLFSTWVKFAVGGDLTQQVFAANAASGGRFIIKRRNTDDLQILAQNAANAGIIESYSAAGTLIDSTRGWLHIAISYDLAAARLQIYLNGSANTPQTFTLTNDTVAYTNGNLAFFNSSGAGSDVIFADIYDYYWNPASGLDLSTNITKFISGGCPVSLGTDGSTPTGSQPILFFSGASATWTTNKGSGGAVTFNAAPAVAGTTPC